MAYDTGLTGKKGKSTPLYRLDEKEMIKWGQKAPTHWQQWIEVNGFSAKPGQSFTLPGDDFSLAAAVVGRSPCAFTDGALASRLVAGDYALVDEDNHCVSAFALGWALENYRFDRFRMSKTQKKEKAKLVLNDPAMLKRIKVLAEATVSVRDLVNLPANHLTPAGLENAAKGLAKKFNAKCDVIKGARLAKVCPAIHTVGRAAEIPPRLIDLRWGKSGPKITLIGKGLTFDSGGLNLKPPRAMMLMKKDMAGSAHVLGVAQAVMAQGLPVHLRVLIATAENAVSSLSMRPLDVIETAAGIPVEIGDTDAEGRLVLADALHLASQVKNDLMINFATLTGAARAALGPELPAMFCNNDALAEKIIHHADAEHDPVWRLPLHESYDAGLDQDGYVALSSTGALPYAGAITAALFLQRFVEPSQPWAHLDIFAWNLSSKPGRPKGGEAMGLRAVVRLIEAIARGD